VCDHPRPLGRPKWTAKAAFRSLAPFGVATSGVEALDWAGDHVAGTMARRDARIAFPQSRWTRNLGSPDVAGRADHHARDTSKALITSVPPAFPHVQRTQHGGWSAHTPSQWASRAVAQASYASERRTLGSP
jgi:hypothetical protein